MILPDKAYTSPSTPPPPDSPGAGDTLPVLGSNPHPLKGPPTMTAQKHLRVALTLPIDPPHPFIAHNAGHPQALANRVQWERAITDDADNIRATVFSEDDMNRSYYYYPEYDPTPDWIPRPAVAWQAIVSELAAEVLA